MSRPMLAVLLALLVPASGLASEQYYKWKDENGVWNYTAAPPKDKTSTTVNIATGANAPTAATASEGGEGQGAGAQKPAAGPDERSPVTNADEMARIKQTQSANCERARGNVATLENNARVQ